MFGITLVDKILQIGSYGNIIYFYENVVK